MPVFLIEFRPLRTLFGLFSLGILMGARHGDPRGVAIAAVYFGLLFWRPLLDAARMVPDIVHEARVTAGWAWGKIFG